MDKNKDRIDHGRKLFVTDMDGTLLNSRKELPPDFEETIRKIEENDCVLAFASGRSYLGLNGMYGKYSDHFGYICDNGAMVVYHGEVLRQDTLSDEDMSEICRTLKIHSKLVLVFCGVHRVYIMKNEPLDDEQMLHLSYYYPVFEEIASPEEVEDDILKVALLFNDDIQKNILPYIQVNDSLTCPVTAYNWIDIFKKQVHKGIGIETLQKKLGIGPEDTIVFGDYQNDLTMIDYAETGYATANAIPEIKEKYTEVIGSCDEGPVTKKIQEILSTS